MQKRILVAFDFDGVVADTLPMLSKVFLSFLQKHNISSCKEPFESYNGKTLSDIINSLHEKYDLQESTESLAIAYQSELLEQIENIDPTKHLISALNALKQMGCSLIISTSANTDYVTKFLKLHNLAGYFEEIVSSTSFVKSKPNPILYASIRDRFPNHEICAIEDSDNGLFSAFNAGVKTVFFNPSKRSSLSCFHNEISDFRELPQKILDIVKNGYFISCENIELKIKDHKSSFTDAELKKIEHIWNNRPQNVYNGHVVAVDSYQCVNESLILTCFFTEYKYIYAAREQIIPLAVSSICCDNENNTILSVRNQVTDYSGSYELIPSGGIEASTLKENPLGYQKQIAKEFAEELGNTVSTQRIRSIKNLGICYDANCNTMDICMQIYYDGDFRKEAVGTNNEYRSNSILIDKIPSVKNLLHGKHVVYTTQEILKHI